MNSPAKYSDDYQTVAERITIFRNKYPEGSLRPADVEHPFRLITIDGQTYVAVTAAAYRHPEDHAPGIGQAWEPIPGMTEYSRGSELMIAETSAWGRAIIAVLAADSRKIATSDEVTAAQQRRSVAAPKAAPKVAPKAAPQPVPVGAAPAPAAAPAQAAADEEAEIDYRALVESIMENVLKVPESTIEDIREAWMTLLQADVLGWRVKPIGDMPPDPDGQVTIGALAKHIANTKQ